METITKFFKEERDPLFRRGEARGEEKKSYEVIKSLIVEFGFTDEEAARASNTTTEFVQKIRTDLIKQKK